MEEENYIPIKASLINIISNYIFPIEIGSQYGTCFFFQFGPDEQKQKYICINNDLLPKDLFISEKEIKINEKIKIKLNKKRKVYTFEEFCNFILIEKDDIVPDEYILDIDLPPNNYNNSDSYLFAYSYLNNKKVIGFIPGKILDIDGYKINHQFNTKNLLSVAPICIMKNKKFKVIGIQLENPDIYKYMSYGYLLVYILTKLNIINANDYNISMNSFVSIKDTEKNNFLTEFSKYTNYSFYTFDQYKNAIYYLHNKISKFYINQNTQDFNNAYNLVKKPKNSDYVNKSNLDLFENINSNWYKIFHNDEIVYNFNEIFLKNDYNVIRDFSYFIAGFIYILNTYGEQKCSSFRNDGDMLIKTMKFTKDDLEGLKNNLNKLITFKTFLCDLNSRDQPNGKINIFVNYFLSYFSFLSFSNKEKYDTKIFIMHKFKSNWKPSCFRTEPYNHCLFNLFTFFKVIDIKIDDEKKSAEIRLENVGKKEIFEGKMWKLEKENKKFNFEYDQNENIIKLI